MNILTALPWILVLVSLIAGAGTSVVYRMKWQGDETTIAQKDADMKGMQTQQAQNIAKAESAVRAALQSDLEHSNKLVADYAAEIAGYQEKDNAAQITIATAPVVQAAPGCTDPMSLPVVGAFVGGLPAQ